MQHILPVAAPTMRPAALQHAQQKARSQQRVFPLKPHQRQYQQYQQQGGEQQQGQQAQQGVQQGQEAQLARQLTLQEMREARFAAAGVRPKVSMKVSGIKDACPKPCFLYQTLSSFISVHFQVLFGDPIITKADGSLGKLVVMPPVHELHTAEEPDWMRPTWIDYSALDAKV